MTTKIKFPNRRFAAVRMTGGIREILDLADKMEKEGRSIIHMDLGCPDFDSPGCAKDAAIKALLDGQVHYTNMSGTDELRRTVAEKYIRENSVPCDADVNIVITAGAMEAMAVAFLTTLDRGDEVILPAPYFPAYADQIAMAGADIKEVQAQEENSFHVTVDQLEAALTPKSRILVLNTPNNPSGAVLSRDDLYKIADFAIRNDLWVISDECYEKFVYNRFRGFQDMVHDRMARRMANMPAGDVSIRRKMSSGSLDMRYVIRPDRSGGGTETCR